jgi:predicted nuclease of restriction endonuclease-like (RecB) superfamily
MKKRRKLVESNLSDKLFREVRTLIEQSKKMVSLTVNQELTLLNWSIGKLVHHTLLKEHRAEYGEKIIATLSQQLAELYGKGYTKSSLSRMINFYKAFPNNQIIATLSQQLSWSHFIEITRIDTPLKRAFYMELAIKENWSIRSLRERIDSMLFERTGISKKPEKLIKEELDRLQTEGPTSPDLVFRDPYILDFLGLQDNYSERDLESAILNSLQQFIIELGSDFAFIARQKRIIIDQEDFWIDLLFFHRGLRRLVAIDLKLDRFRAAYKGQMELYLKWLDKYERKKGEEAPLGLILCSEKRQEQIELLELDKGHIRVSQYLTQLPSKKVLAQKLKKAIEMANATSLATPNSTQT